MVIIIITTIIVSFLIVYKAFYTYGGLGLLSNGVISI